MKYKPFNNLKHMYELACILPKYLSQRKTKELVEVAKKHQVKLGKIKRSICFNCYTILIYSKSMDIKYEKRENGYQMIIKCNNCNKEKNFIERNK